MCESRDLFWDKNIMRTLPVLIGAILIGATIVAVWLLAGYFHHGKISEDTLTLYHCTGDRFAFIQGTYLSPVTDEEIEVERAAVLQGFRAEGGDGPRAGGAGGGGPGEPRTLAWGYYIDDDGVPSNFGYAMGSDGPARHAIEESNRWYQDHIVNQSLDVNVTCSSRTVVERFKYGIWDKERVM